MFQIQWRYEYLYKFRSPTPLLLRFFATQYQIHVKTTQVENIVVFCRSTVLIKSAIFYPNQLYRNIMKMCKYFHFNKSFSYVDCTACRHPMWSHFLYGVDIHILSLNLRKYFIFHHEFKCIVLSVYTGMLSQCRFVSCAEFHVNIDVLRE